MSGNIVQATNETFNAEINVTGPVLVDFWAEWCGPCRALAPVLEEVAREYAGKVKVLKVNVDDNQETAMRFGVMSIPTMVFLKGGEEADKLVGAHPKSKIKEKLDALL
ncbi:MAG TPA: thioredoxin [Candidatus Omnitrophota bacterium]|nr:thioredoxin [Candidatus Omnitrophota bacterium]